MNLPASRDERLPGERCKALLDAFLDGPCDVDAALLSTADGRALALATRSRIDAARVAAIAGSLLALAETCTHELRHGICRNAIVDGEHGITTMLRIRVPRGAWTLTTISSRSANLGLLFTHSKQLGEALSAIAKDEAASVS